MPHATDAPGSSFRGSGVPRFHVKQHPSAPGHDKGGPPRRTAFIGTRVRDQVLGRLPWFAPFLRLVLRLRARLLDMMTSWALET